MQSNIFFAAAISRMLAKRGNHRGILRTTAPSFYFPAAFLCWL